VKITGFKKPWTSKPIAPGGQEVVDRYANDSEDKIQVAFFDTASGHLLLKQSFGSEMTDESMTKPDRIITYPHAPKPPDPWPKKKLSLFTMPGLLPFEDWDWSQLTSLFIKLLGILDK